MIESEYVLHAVRPLRGISLAVLAQAIVYVRTEAPLGYELLQCLSHMSCPPLPRSRKGRSL